MVRPVTVRLRRMAFWELANVAWIAAVVFGIVDVPFTAANLTGYGLAAFLLVQGFVYWLAESRRLAARRRPSTLTGWRLLRVVNPIVLAAGGVVVAAGIPGQSPSRWLPGLLLTLLAVAEYVNYFLWQLMYDNGRDLRRLARVRRLKRSHLATQLRHRQPVD